MKNQSGLLACASLLLLASSIVQSQNADCENVKFSDEILNRFPQAPEACLDVISRDGEEYAVFRVQLDRVTGNTLQVRFNQPDGSQGPTTRIATSPEFRVLVDGTPTRVRDLAPRQELTAYVQVSRPMVALAPASETEKLLIVPLFVAVREDRTELAAATDDPSMPDTAGPAPLAGALGLLFVALAAGMRALRRRGDNVESANR